jgi:hypothetical protein
MSQRDKTNLGEHIMPYINAAQISGNLGKDAETMTTQGGRTVTRFSIASSKKWTWIARPFVPVRS